MDLRTFLQRSPDLTQGTCAARFAQRWRVSTVQRGAQVARQGEPAPDEVIVLDGRLLSRICDPEGREVCVGLYAGPGVVTPTIARTRGGASLVSIGAATDATIARIDGALLTELMLASVPVRDWANGVLREALAAKADREWGLAALGGADRLAWFRGAFPEYEAIFPHTLIASFLGMTPVTLSRLRGKDR
jgi:CRP-like cAMP-binding protein